MKINFLKSTFFVLLLLLPPTVFAEGGWEKFYGPELANAPLSLREEFANARGMPWHKATYEERAEFLDAKEALIEQRKQDLVNYENSISSREQRIAATIKAREDAKKERLKKQKEREKAKAEEKKAKDRKLRDLKKKREEAMKRLKQMDKRRNR